MLSTKTSIQGGSIATGACSGAGDKRRHDEDSESQNTRVNGKGTYGQ